MERFYEDSHKPGVYIFYFCFLFFFVLIVCSLIFFFFFEGHEANDVRILLGAGFLQGVN
jgi:hypothetical protein